MAMEPTNNDADVFNATYEVQMLNLGRIIENPALVLEFEASDFLDREMSGLIQILKSDKTLEAKNLHLKTFMKQRGLGNWGPDSSGCKKELFDTQRRQKAIHALAFHTNLIIDDLMNRGYMGDNTAVLNALATVKGFIEDAAL